MLPGIRIQYVSIDIFIKLLHIKLNNYIMHEYQCNNLRICDNYIVQII